MKRWVLPNSSSGTTASKTVEIQKDRFKNGRSKVKVMLTIFFDDQGVVYHKYASEGQTINKQYYLEVLRYLGTGRGAA